MSLQKPLLARAWSAARAAVVLVCVLSTMGYAGAAELKVSPGNVSFGKRVVGGTSVAETVTVANNSWQSVEINSVSLSSLDFAYSGPALPIILAPGHRFSGSVMFLPTAARKYSAQLTFETKRFSTTVELTGTGTAAPVSPSSDPPPAVTPTITWTAPAAIHYGTALSAAQLNAAASAAGSFAYSPALGTMLTAGNHTLSMTFTPTNTTAYTAATDNVLLTVNKVTPAISWATPAAIASGTALSATQLDATANVAGSFAYSSALGTVLTAGSHTLSVTFTPANTTDYNTAMGSVVLIVNTVSKVTPTITWTTPTAISYGTALSPAQLDATASTAGSLAYSPALGTVLTAGSQTLSVAFTPTDTTDYNTATGSVVLTVNKATPTITWPTPTAIVSGTALSAAQLAATANTAGSFAYSPALGTALSAGSQTLSVTFTPSDTTDYNTATSSVTLTVNPVTKVTPTITWPTPTSMPYGTALSAAQLDATASTAGSFVYSPAAGATLGAGSQTLSVTFTPTDTTGYSSATGSVVLSVGKATPTITWATPGAISYGTALSAAQLDATANTAGSFAYSPALGTVQAAGSQTLSVTFTPTDTTGYSSATGSVVLSVGKATPTITWATPGAISYGTALSAAQLDATANTAGSFAYSPALGTVQAAGSQTLSVAFTPTDTTDYNTATGSVVLTVNKVTPTITWPTPTAIISGTALSATQLDATANTAGSFAYSPALGTVLSAGSQTLSVTFTPSDTTDYNTATGSAALIVNAVTKVTPTITWTTPTSISYGTALSATQLDAAASTAGSFAYSPALGTVLTAGSQTLSVTFTPTDTTDYNPATGSVVLSVNKVTPTITWPTPTAIVSGTALSAAQLAATANTAGSFAYSPALGTVLSAGSQTLSVTFTPTDTTDYNTATGSVTLTVNPVTKVTPTITWPTPTSMPYGTALSAAQLDASASTAGSFVYSPAPGAVLGAGNQTLSVTFTPSNTTNYNTATGSVTLTVSKATPTITWPTPTAITSGTALSAAQLDASASTAGSFVYSPGPGTVPSAGSQTLSVTFTPTDTIDYNAATGSVMLTVNSATPATGTLTVSPTSVSFGNIKIGTNGSQAVTLTNSGSGSVAISNVSTTSGVGVSGASTGMVLTGGQSANLDLTLAVSGTGSVTGGVTVASNASNSSLTIPVSANGVNPSVSLSWSTDPSATGGYNVYSSMVSGGPYNQRTSTPITTPAYTDSSVQAGLTYYYVVTAIDATTNMQSGYSNQASAVVP